MNERASSSELHRLAEGDVSREAFLYYRRLGRVRRFVLDHYDEPISLEDAANVAAMERTSFSDFFHRTTGSCFRDWLAAVRVTEAMKLMASTNLPIRKVAAKVGFNNVRTFERVFLRVAGRPPIEFKKRVRPL